MFELKCEIREKVSKTGNPYTVLALYLTDTCVKEVYLESSEKELLKIKMKESSVNEFNY